MAPGIIDGLTQARGLAVPAGLAEMFAVMPTMRTPLVHPGVLARRAGALLPCGGPAGAERAARAGTRFHAAAGAAAAGAERAAGRAFAGRAAAGTERARGSGARSA